MYTADGLCYACSKGLKCARHGDKKYQNKTHGHEGELDVIEE